MSSEKYSKGPCVLGEKCKCPNMELRPEHTCPDCNQIVHVLCGKFCKTRDKCVCGCVLHQSVAVKEININAGEQMAMVSTITQSTTASENNFKEIPRDYFICKDQKINKQSKLDGGEEFSNLRTAIIKSINDKLKSMMILQAQKIDLQVTDKKTGELRKVQGFRDIGLAWKTDNEPKTAAKINTIINSTFTENSGYEYYLETKIMKEYKLKYGDDDNIKGSIARMIVLRKCELAKSINKRAEKTHQKRIVKVRMKHEDVNDKKIEKKNPNSYRIDNAWFNDDGSEYTKTETLSKKSDDDTMFFMERIKQLQEELKQTKEV